MLSDVRPAVHEKIRVGLHFRKFDPRVGLEKRHGFRKRNPPVSIRIHRLSPRILAEVIAGLAKSILLLLEHAGGCLPKGAGFHRACGEKA